MIFKLLKKTVLVFGVFCFIGNVSAQKFVNILNEDYYGFEVTSGDDGWWMQQPDNLSVASDKGANGSSHSLKYTNSTAFTGSKKAFGSTTISDMLIDLEPGTYNISAMVWVESGAQISSVRANFRTAGLSDVNVTFNLGAVAKDEWVKVTSQLNITNAFVDTNVRIMFDSSATSIGTMYFDDLVILDEAPPVIEEIPSFSEIVTIDGNNLSLAKGTYDISLKIWVDEDASMKSFYTYIKEPWVATKWELSEVTKGEWVELKKQVVLEEAANNSEFKIRVNNNPNYGGGKGRFYIDDINLIKAKSAYEEADNFVVQVTGESCPNKGNGKVEIKAKHNEDYIVEFNNSNYNFTNELVIDNIAPGIYDLCISVKNTDFKSCFTIKIEESNTITAKISNSKSRVSQINIEEGTAPFTVSINDKEVLTTSAQSFKVETISGDIVEVKSNKDCEGLFIETINMQNGIRIYPNPASIYLNVLVPENSKIEIYSVIGELMYSKETLAKRNSILVSSMTQGIYLVKIVSANNVFTEKIVIK